MVTRIKRAVLVVALGLFVSLLARPADAAQAIVLNNENGEAVLNNPPGGNPEFTLSQLSKLEYVRTYHWNGGRGAPVGSISLMGGPNNLQYGPWKASAAATFWVVQPIIALPAGTYRVVDSDPGTRSYNARSGNKGFAMVLASPVPVISDVNDGKGVVSILHVQDRPQVINTFSDDIKGPVQATYGYRAWPSVAADRASPGVGQVVTVRVANAFPGYLYYFEVISSGPPVQTTGSGADYVQFKASGPGTFTVICKTKASSVRSAPPYEFQRLALTVR